ncbi:MAG TPA: serine hydrolase domain-containing protein, partial [Microthrixaceae bacterium]|nr:serine hydrolase domain-containing protein [Microthrixaceae bacterium]
ADSSPVWEPGTQHGYHAVTYGWLVGELIRRVSGQSIGEYFAANVAAPLGLDFWIGLPDEEHARVAELIPFELPSGILPPPAEGTDGVEGGGASGSGGFIQMLDALLGTGNLAGKALSAPGGAFSDQDSWNDPRVWSAMIPAANGITNARSLARMYAACIGEVDGVRLLSPETLANAIEPRTEGPDSVLMFPIPFGLGFMRNSDFSPFTSPAAFGHYGAGGAVGFADPDSGLAFGYAMNQMQLGLAGDPRTNALIDVAKSLL